MRSAADTGLDTRECGRRRLRAVVPCPWTVAAVPSDDLVQRVHIAALALRLIATKVPRVGRPPLATRARFGRCPPLMSGVLARARFKSLHLSPGNYASALGDFDLHFERFDLAAQVFALRGLFEWRIATVASLVLQRGDTVFEGGAHYGTETFYYGWLVGSHGHVVSFEADPALANRLAKEAERQSMGQCHVVHSALGAETGMGTFATAPAPDMNSGLGALVPTTTSSGDGLTSVRVTTLDAAMDAHGPPKMVVMDIQGGELGALRGGLGVLKTARPIVVLEVESSSLAQVGGSASEVLKLLEEQGYRCWRFTRGGLSRVTTARHDELGDWLALPAEQVHAVSRIRSALVLTAITPPSSPLSPLGRARKRRRQNHP